MYKYKRLAEDFRAAVTEDTMFYCSQKNDNNWNIICSSMDWLTHSGSQLDNDYSEKLFQSKDTFEYIVPYIAYIDIYYESYLQLYRCIMNKDDKYNLYYNTNNLFKKSYYKFLKRKHKNINKS